MSGSVDSCDPMSATQHWNSHLNFLFTHKVAISILSHIYTNTKSDDLRPFLMGQHYFEFSNGRR